MLPLAHAAQPGAIVGVVTNSAKLPVAGVTVTAVTADGGAIRATVSGSDGVYSFADLPPGAWSLTLDAAGYPQVAVPALQVLASKATRRDVVMNVPAVAQTVSPALQAPEAGPEVDTQTQFAVGDIGWMNGNSREKAPIFDTRFFTPEIRFDVNYLQDFNHPVDHTIVGSTEEFREAGQDRDGGVQVSLGAKGVVELELMSSGEHWGRGPLHDVHSSLEAQVDSPSWHLVQALNTLVEKDGHTPAVDGFFDKAKPLTAAQQQMIRDHAAKTAESTVKKVLGVQHWVHDANWADSLMLLESKPTINIEGLVGGYTGPGGKTVLPHKAVAKIDMRLVPDMTAADTLAKLKAHLARRGFADIEVNMSGGYDPTQTDRDSKLIQTQLTTYGKLGLDPQLWPRSAGSWPGYVFTDVPLKLPAGHFGLGHGTGAHAPDEYYLIESTNPKVQGLDGAVASFVEYLYALA